jgi:hypothetical protein
MESLPKEGRIILALEALKKDPQLSVRKCHGLTIWAAWKAAVGARGAPTANR